MPLIQKAITSNPLDPSVSEKNKREGPSGRYWRLIVSTFRIVDTRFSCPMVKKGRVSNNYEFEGCAATL